MSDQSQGVNDPRGLIFTIDRRPEPVYQVESQSWACAEHLWRHDEIPPEILAKISELEENGQPGAFVRFLHGEDGIYVLCEKNIKALPEPAAEDATIDPTSAPGGGRTLSAYDIVVCAKGGTIRAENGDVYQTAEGECYVIRCGTWGRFIMDQEKRPSFVQTTKEVLLLLEDLHGKNFLSMTPDKHEGLPSDMLEPTVANDALHCYVLNLSRFKR
ncbi:MAG TPA: hypothetical protein VLS89_17345 [Candidatus Nanopelagicales bacterium]|nr:hypothetical protein [Candidatus Nanopelagicales bacterium]